MAKAAQKVAEGAARYVTGEMQGAERLLQNLDVWTTATRIKSTSGRGSGGKIELAGIKKLRELILELAVRGKLVPQDPDDEPALALLEHIQQEKANLVADGDLKKQRPLPPIRDDDKSFSLPSGWEWEKLQTVTAYIQRGKGPKYAEQGTVKVISQKCVQWSGFHPELARFVDDTTLTQYGPERFLIGGDLLWNSTGTGTVGRVTVLNLMPERTFVADSHVTVIRPLGMSSIFLKYFLASPGVQDRIEPTHERSLVSGTTKQVELNKSTVNSLAIPVPPLAEQHRIVAKVDELMALCDQLEQQTEQQLDAHQQLVETLLNTLTQSQNADELAANWQRLAEHFDLLFSGPMGEWAVDRLKDTILQLAVMGKLVPQDPNDEPASVLLERIQQEKARLIAEGKIKKQKPLPPISEEGKPFALPEGWEWVRLLSIAHVGTGATPSRDNPSYYQPQDHMWVTSGETSEPFVLSTREKVSELAVRETNVSIYPVGTLIVAMYGQGKTRGQITELRVPAGTNQACAAILLVDLDESHRSYVKKYFQKSYEDLRSLAEGGAQPNLNVGKVSNTLIPLPPSAEQKRITAKVDELFRVCDELILKIRAAGETELTICDVLVEKALVH